VTAVAATRPLRAGLFASAGLLGLGAVASPALVVAATVALVLCVAVFADLGAGVALFTLASFAEMIDFGGGASGAKAVGLLLLVSWLAAMGQRGARRARDLVVDHRAIALCAVLLLTWSAASTLWAQSPSSAFAATGRYALGLALFPIVYAGVRRSEHVAWVAWAFVAGALASALYGALTGPTGHAARLSGAGGDPNETAAALVAGAMLALALAARASRGSQARFWAAAAALASLVCLAATASRGGLIALAAALAVAVAIAGRRRARAAAVALVCSLLVAAWFTQLAPGAAREHVQRADTSGRTTIWTVAVRTIRDRPVAGVGSDNFRVTSTRYLLAPGATKRADLIVETPKVAHNVYLETWADLGAVGMLLFGALIALALRCAVRAARLLRSAGRHRDELLARGLAVAIVGMLVADAFVSDVWSKQLWLLLALAPAQLAVARASEGALR